MTTKKLDIDILNIYILLIMNRLFQECCVPTTHRGVFVSTTPKCVSLPFQGVYTLCPLVLLLPVCVPSACKCVYLQIVCHFNSKLCIPPFPKNVTLPFSTVYPSHFQLCVPPSLTSLLLKKNRLKLGQCPNLRDPPHLVRLGHLSR